MKLIALLISVLLIAGCYVGPPCASENVSGWNYWVDGCSMQYPTVPDVYPISQAVHSNLPWSADFQSHVYPGSSGPSCVIYEPYRGLQVYTPATCGQTLNGHIPVGMVPCEGVSCGYGDCLIQCYGRLF